MGKESWHLKKKQTQCYTEEKEDMGRQDWDKTFWLGLKAREKKGEKKIENGKRVQNWIPNLVGQNAELSEEKLPSM